MFGKYNYDVGVQFYNSGNYNDAIKYFDKAISSGDLDSVGIYNSLLNKARACIMIKEYNVAISDLGTAIKILPDEYLAYYEIGRAYYALERFDFALDYFDKSIERCGDNALSWDMKGLSLMKLEKYNESEKSLTQALKYAMISDTGRVKEIEEEIEKVKILIRNNTHIIEKEKRESKIIDKYHEGLNYFKQKRYYDAITQFDEALSNNPNDSNLTYSINIYKGRCLKGLKDYKEAVIVFQTAIKISSGRYYAYYEIGEIYYAQKDYHKAVSFFVESLKRNKNNAASYLYLGLSQIYLGNFELGKFNINNSLTQKDSLNGTDIENIRMLTNSIDSYIGFILLGHDKTDDAVGLFEKSLSINPNDILAKCGKGLYLYYNKKYEEALPYLKQDLNRISMNKFTSWIYPIVTSFIGASYFNQGYYETSLKYLNKVIADDNNVNSDIWYYKGCSHFELRQYKEALEAFRKSLDINEDTCDIGIPEIENKIRVTNEIIDKEKTKASPSHITIQGNNNPINFGGIMATDDAIINRSEIENDKTEEFCFCRKCGAKIKSNDVFCRKCGAKLN